MMKSDGLLKNKHNEYANKLWKYKKRGRVLVQGINYFKLCPRPGRRCRQLALGRQIVLSKMSSLFSVCVLPTWL